EPQLSVLVPLATHAVAQPGDVVTAGVRCAVGIVGRPVTLELAVLVVAALEYLAVRCAALERAGARRGLAGAEDCGDYDDGGTHRASVLRLAGAARRTGTRDAGTGELVGRDAVPPEVLLA